MRIHLSETTMVVENDGADSDTELEPRGVTGLASLGRRFAVLDLEMPGLDGLGTARALLAREPQAAIVMTTRQGKKVADIAATLRLAAGTVRNYLSDAMSTLGATDRHRAAHAARHHGCSW